MGKIFIRHRVNSIRELGSLEKSWGVEIDLRSSVNLKGSIHLSHDPWSLGDDFETWLNEFKRQEIQGPIWLNTKEDGLEDRIEELMVKYQISDFIFLDTVLPTLVKKTQFQNKTNFAIRYSLYEPKEMVNYFRGKADWLWVDCFQGLPVELETVRELKKSFRICMVSPELHGKSLQEKMKDFIPLFEISDAVCSKEPKVWGTI